MGNCKVVMLMRRKLTEDLMTWLNETEHKPLILRGARQTGKTYIIRHLAQESGRHLVELNFEKHPEYGELFESNDPRVILGILELMLGADIDPERSILFLDEVQACAEIIGKLRWFYEELPALPVVAAGSLLEFAMDEYNESLPVGRVTYMYLYPLTFTEFLWAMGEEKLADHLQEVRRTLVLPEALHRKYLEYYRQYTIIGGMPEVVRSWNEYRKIQRCLEIQKDLLTSYQDDFNKYRKRVPAEVLRKAMNSVAYQLGGRFIYTSVDRDMRQAQIKVAVEMLEKAGICKRVYHSAGQGIPLGSQKKDLIFKTIFLDCGLAMSILGLQPLTSSQLEEVMWANKGAMAEQVVGQSMLAAHSHDHDDLFYWQQIGSGNGEIDYLAQDGDHVLPIEVKSGVSGSMKSLHSFMENRKLGQAIRFDLNPPSMQDVNVKTTKGKPVRYMLLSLPLYMAEYIAVN